jgi:hypothetical protein
LSVTEHTPGGKAVRVPAAGLPPRSFAGRAGNWPAWISSGVVVLALGTIVLAVRGFSLGFFIVMLVVCGVLAGVGGTLWPGTRVVGGEGWLMLVRRRRCRAWVRTGQLTLVSLEFPRDSGGDVMPLLTLRDDEGRELKAPLSALTQQAAASLLAGIRQSAEGPLHGLDSQATQAAVTALHELARAIPLPGAPRDPGGQSPGGAGAG